MARNIFYIQIVVINLYCILPASAFLLQTNGTVNNPNLMNNIHFDTLMKLLMAERSASFQLQNYVVKQFSNANSFPDLLKILANVTKEHEYQVNQTALLLLKFSKLQAKLDGHEQHLNAIEQNLIVCRTKTAKLETQMTTLLQMKSINDAHTLSSLVNNLTSVSEVVQNLQMSDHARSQDLMALFKEVQESKTPVGFTAFGIGRRKQKTINTILTFPDVRTSYGMGNMTSFKETGVFRCEKEGMYLILTVIMAGTKGDSMYKIYKNDQDISNLYYLGFPSAGSRGWDYNSGSGILLTELKVNDTVSVKAETSESHFIQWDEWSSLTVVKLK